MGAMRYVSIAALSVAVVGMVGMVGACAIETPAEPAAQPSAPASSIPTDTPTSSTPTSPSSPSTPHGSPSRDCRETIKAVRADFDKAVWGKGLAKAEFDPVSVTICRYDAEAAGNDYAAVRTRRTGSASTDLFGLLNAAEPVGTRPKRCTRELGPTYLLMFTDQDRGVLTYAVEGFGCRRLVATFRRRREAEGPRRAAPGDAATAEVARPARLTSMRIGSADPCGRGTGWIRLCPTGAGRRPVRHDLLVPRAAALRAE
jgi:hypothetical protein